MVFGKRKGFCLTLCVIFHLTGTIFATLQANAQQRQYIYNTTDDYNPAVACTDSGQNTDRCAKAGQRCHCEENRYEMYTYCKRSCGYCGVERLPQRFWRVVNWAPLNRTWFVSEIQFFKSKHDKTPLVTNNPASAIASSTYLSFPASQAFDGNRDTAWLPDGWWERMAGGDWIGYDFPAPVDINAVRIISDYNDSSDVSAKILVEAGPTAFGPFQTKWMSMNADRNPDMKFTNPRCPLFWKRFMTDKDAFCYKLVTEYLSWSEARDKCGSYGGDLVSITSHEEQVFVQQELLACGFTWLGMNDREKEGKFKNSDGTNSSFFYWANDIESDERMDENEDCVAMQTKGEWRTFHCENKFYFFCKKRIMTDNDKIVPPNTAHRPTEHVNQTLPEGVPPPETPLPPEVDYPPGVTPPPPPPYPYPYPTSKPPTTGKEKSADPASKTDKTTQSQTGPASETPPAPDQPAAGTQQAGGTTPQAATGAQPATGVQSATGAQPAAGAQQAAGAQLIAGKQPAAGVQPSAATKPAASTQPASAPSDAAAPSPDLPPPSPAAAPVPQPKEHLHHDKKLKKKHHHKAFHGTFKLRKAKKISHKKKKAKTNKKKAIKAQKHHDDKLDVDMDDDFLDMVTRSNIPRPEISEKQLKSDIENGGNNDVERR